MCRRTVGVTGWGTGAGRPSHGSSCWLQCLRKETQFSPIMWTHLETFIHVKHSCGSNSGNVAPYLLRHFSACTDINQTRLYCCFLQRQTLRVYWNTAELYNQILSGWSFCFVSSEQLFTILTQNCCAASKEGLLWVIVQQVQKRWLGNVPVLCRTEMFAAAEQKQRSGTRFVC